MSSNVSQPAQPARPVLIDLPQPPSAPDTPCASMPGTPTSTTTSISALSTIAIKDGHRGAALPPHRGHHSNPSTNSLEAERADRISRLTGLSSISRPNNNNNQPGAAGSAQTTPTSSGFLPNQQTTNPGQYLTPAYFDAQGQPVAATKMSTVGTASASATTAQDLERDEDMGDAMDRGTDGGDEDLLSMDTNYEGSASASGYRDMDPMEEDRSVGGYDDRMSDDGSASLVGFGEGAGSTVSGPIYHRRPIPGGLGSSSAGAMDRHLWGLDRRDSGLSASVASGDGGIGGGRRETVVGRPQQTGLSASGSTTGGADTPVTGAEREHRAALQLDGVAADPAAGELDDGFVDTSARGPVPATSAIRETQQPGVQQQQVPPSTQYPGGTSREAAERIVRERLGEEKGDAPMESPQGPGLGKFYFEEKK
ncbi:hypothetical protein GE09DRAFT_343613 [Coniochaeta sp. 2T2.1]|nr:hypothetical protein GE09DRAFT_343613 [Coniochaeta sp. 2T2.1]